MKFLITSIVFFVLPILTWFSLGFVEDRHDHILLGYGVPMILPAMDEAGRSLG